MKNLVEAETQKPKKPHDELPEINKNLGEDTDLSKEVPKWSGNFFK